MASAFGANAIYACAGSSTGFRQGVNRMPLRRWHGDGNAGAVQDEGLHRVIDQEAGKV